MDEYIFESGKHEITSEHAVLIPALSSLKSPMPYVEAVAAVIGSCHIHSVYEDRDHIKIYLKDKRFVDILVNNGVSIWGRQINVDYAVPRADKIILSNVDPIVPDSILMKLLCYYGNPVSAIIHEKIATNSEYSHIECGKRNVYMKIFPGKKIPAKVNFTYQNMYFRIDVSVESKPREDVYETVSAPTAYEEQIEDSNDVVEIETADIVKPDIEEIKPKKKPSEKQLAYRLRGKSKANSATNMARRLKKRARKGWFGRRNAIGSKRYTQKNKGKLRLAVKKHLAVESKKSKMPGSEMKSEGTSRTNSIIEENLSVSSILESKDLSDQSSADANDISQYVTQYPLTMDDLVEFMKKTRFHRDPCQIAWEFLSEKTPESLEALKIQLHEYHQASKDTCLKFRIKRVMALLKYPKDSIDE